MTLRLWRPHDNVLLVTAKTAGELGRAFVRPQEFYESPSQFFRGRVFPLDVFKRWYSRHYGKGRFTYYSDFQGYNMPGEVFLDWQKAYASNETAEEQQLLELLGALPAKFYLIGAVEKDAAIVEHELSHAFFHLSGYYRQACVDALRRHDAALAPLRAALRKIMYREEVLDDECVSYVLFEDAWMRRQGVAVTSLRELRADLAHYYGLFDNRLRPRRAW